MSASAMLLHCCKAMSGHHIIGLKHPDSGLQSKPSCLLPALLAARLLYLGTTALSWIFLTVALLLLCCKAAVFGYRSIELDHPDNGLCLESA